MIKVKPWNYLHDYVYEHNDYLVYPTGKDNKSPSDFYEVYSPDGELLNEQIEYATDWGTCAIKVTSKAKLNNKVFDLSSPNSCQVFIEAHNGKGEK